MHHLRLSIAFAALASLSACGERPAPSDKGAEPQGDAKAAAPLKISTTFHPTAYMAARIGGDAVRVTDLCPEEADPAFWRPTPEDLGRYQASDLILLNGAGFERWAALASLPLSKTVDTTRLLKGELITYETAITHSHGPDGDHTHEGVDGHTWVDPLTALLQARVIHEALVRARPTLKATFDRGLETLGADLKALDQRLQRLSGERPALKLVANHPAYSYLARRYGWSVKAFDLDPEADITPAQLGGLKALIEGHPARLLLWESAPTPATEKALKAHLGLTSVVFSPGEHAGPDGRDLLDTMRGNVTRLEAALRDLAPSPP